jgi:hypothetical protein
MGEPPRRFVLTHLLARRRAIRGSLRSYLRRLWRLGTRLRRAATIPLASWRRKRLKNLEVWGEWCMFVDKRELGNQYITWHIRIYNA